VRFTVEVGTMIVLPPDDRQPSADEHAVDRGFDGDGD
jgi:hypothetical protein